MRRIISLLIFVLVLIYCFDLQAKEYFEIVESETDLEVTFESVVVPKGSISEQIIPLVNVRPKDYTGVIGFIRENSSDDYKTILPHENYVNPNFHTRYEIAYKKDGGLIALIRRLENRSDIEDWNLNTKTVYIDWYLLRVREN